MLNEFISDAGSLTQIDSEDELIEGALRWTKDGNGGGVGNDNGTSYGSAPLAAGFPKGYRAFYCMKYELSQKQYVDFLNTLTRTQQNARGVAGDSDRNTIVAQAADNGEENPVVFVAERPDRAANFLIWIDGCAYADWAGLRPMTELEFEKAARGNQPVVSEEYAWGTTQIKAGRILSGLEDGTEVITDEGTNANYEFSGGLSFSGGDGGQGPLRCGIFAREETTREQAGAGYYGVMDLSGNVTETCVTVAAIKGLNEQPIPGAGQFDGRHGDGVLSEDGHADVPNWPGRDENGEVVTAEGSGHRGGSFGSSRFPLSVSDRGSAAEISISPLRTGTGGFRAVRTASQD